METFNPIQDRFVVFLDIMGFKDRVARSTPENLYAELTDFNRDITTILNSSKKVNTQDLSEQSGESSSTMLSSVENSSKIELAQFSDSIVLFSRDNSKESLSEISNVAREIMFSAINREKPIPLKGALAEGNVTCDLSKRLFFGQPLIDAYLLEENVQYYGIVVHHTAERSVKNLDEGIFSDTSVPLKSGRIRHYELVWYSKDYKSAEYGLEKIRLSVSDSPRKYVDNTNTVIAEYKSKS
ncbi:MAG: hypothetical protein K2H35_02915 [Muribaculaceae bacterium]|nr:hypothetical protein [Muribaculaceae bacterium]